MKLALLVLCAVAFYFRTGTLRTVFADGQIMFLETDPWYHVRVIEHLVRNFPWRMHVDPYSTLHYREDFATGPFFDYVIATIAWIAGLGHPSEHLIHLIAVWMPAMLGTLIVPAVFLLARECFGKRGGLIAAAVAATLPGHFLTVGNVGYTDHHVMESLLSTIVLYLALRGNPLAFGLALGAYVLTFVGGAFLVASIVVWMGYEQIRSRWARKDAAPAITPFVAAFAVAFGMGATSYRTLWMGYSLAALGGGIALVLGIDFWSRRTKSQPVFFSGVVAGLAIAASTIALRVPGAFHILTRLVPSFADRSQGVAELQSMFVRNGVFTVRIAWDHFGGAIVFAAVAVFALIGPAVRFGDFRKSLIIIWALVTFPLAAGQIRMTYYLGITVAVLCGYLLDEWMNGPAYAQWGIAILAFLLIFAPNVYHATEVHAGESVSADWREALAWLRQNTEEPFGDPSYYLALYRDSRREASYSVMSWWDYGYWITALGRRVPVSNPTQANAAVAASALVAQTETESAELMERWKSRYLVLDQGLPMLGDLENVSGKFPNLFAYSPERSVEDYMLITTDRDANGLRRKRVLYRPAYFQTTLVRLFIFGGEAIRAESIFVARLKDRELVDLREYRDEESALAAERSCSLDGCVMVSTSPFISCVAIDSMTRFQPVFNSSTAVLETPEKKRRSSVQIYEFR